MNKTLKDIVSGFSTTPVLFVGSGLSRRYYDLPDWRNLLKIFASRISSDAFALNAYEDAAKSIADGGLIYPIVAELIEKDFNKMWFSNKGRRKLNDYYLELVANGTSPFKAEIAMFTEENSKQKAEYRDEIDKLRDISKKSISGVITTNYDTLLESLMDEYKVYIGQEELIFSAIQGIAEIYKIHGTVKDPDSIVINRRDYQRFDEKSSYLAAKLMTIFMEYPIVFIGYSLTDPNIQNIIKSIVNCLSSENIEKLKERFVFVDYKEGISGVEIAPHSMVFDEKMLYMTKVSLSDLGLLYDALAEKKSKIPVKILRKFKEELYAYAISNVPTANIRVGSIDDPRIVDEDLVLSIGKVGDFGLKGLSGLSGNEWYRNIVLGDLSFDADELLQYAFPKLIKQNSNKLPFYKLLKDATQKFEEVQKVAQEVNFDNIISDSIKNNRKALGRYKSVEEIWKSEKQSLERATRLIAYLKKEQIGIDELEEVLKRIFEEKPNIFEEERSSVKTNIRRLIRIYDYLKYSN